MQSSHAQMMADAKLLAQGFKLGSFNDSRGGSARGRGGHGSSRVGGNGPVSTAPRTDYSRGNPRGPYSSSPHTATMTRPLKVDKNLMSFLDGSAGRPNATGNTAPTAPQTVAPHLAHVQTPSLAPAVSQQTNASTSSLAPVGIPPHLAPRAVASQNAATTRPADLPEAPVAKAEPAAGSAAHEHGKQDHVEHEQPPAPAQRTGLRQSIWADNDNTTAETPRKDTHVVGESCNSKESELITINNDDDNSGSQDEQKKHAVLEGNASRMLADMPIAPTIATTGNSTTPDLTKRFNFFDLMEALKEGKPFPPLRQLSEVEQSLPTVDGMVAQSVIQSTSITELTQNITDGPKTCDCPERPLHGLSSSMFNVDKDGNKSISDPQKFLVNAILHKHSNEDCPILQECKNKYPLWFGAIPATLPEQEDDLEVIPYTETAAKKRAPQKTGHSRGLSSSIWA